jgi:octaprenyl-diphosphate synthase
VHNNGGMKHAKKAMYEYANKAIDSLSTLPNSQAKQDFSDLIHFVITRKK